MRVLITGASGFLGRYVVRAVADRGHEVRALVRSSRQLPEQLTEEVEVVYGDLRRRSELDGLLAGVDAIIQLAASVRGDDDTQFADTVVGTENLLEAAASQGIERFVLCSSFAVYDWRRAASTLDEECPLEANLYARDGYAISKVWQERLVRRYADSHNWRLTVLRPGFIWGPDNLLVAGTGHSFGKIHVVFGGQRELPISYVENCAECFAAALDHPAAVGETFNVVDYERVSAWRYMGCVMRATGMKGCRFYVPYWMGLMAANVASGIGRVCFGRSVKLPGLLVPIRYRARFRPLRFSNRKVKEILGWRPRYDFRQAWERACRPPRTESAEATERMGVVSQEALRGN